MAKEFLNWIVSKSTSEAESKLEKARLYSEINDCLDRIRAATSARNI